MSFPNWQSRGAGQVGNLPRHGGVGNRQSAFTLVELLAVIAIIGVIAALLFPAFGKVTDRKNTTVCLSNMRQWGSALMIYASDNDGTLPQEGMAPGGIDIEKEDAWFNALAPHMGSPSLADLVVTNWLAPNPGDKNVFMCPAMRPRDVVDNDGNKVAYTRRTAVFAYGYNLWIDHGSRASAHGQQPDEATFGQRLRMSQITKPAKFAVFGEGGTISFDNISAQYIHYRHEENNAANIAFADGHAATFDRSEIYVSGSETDAKQINRGVIWDPEGIPDQWDSTWQ